MAQIYMMRMWKNPKEVVKIQNDSRTNLFSLTSFVFPVVLTKYSKTQSVLALCHLNLMKSTVMRLSEHNVTGG